MLDDILLQAPSPVGGAPPHAVGEEKGLLSDTDDKEQKLDIEIHHSSDTIM